MHKSQLKKMESRSRLPILISAYCLYSIPPITFDKGVYKPDNLSKNFQKGISLTPTSAINNLIRDYSIMKKYLIIIPLF